MAHVDKEVRPIVDRHEAAKRQSHHVQRDGVSMPVLADNRPHANVQAQLAATVRSSPRMIVQRALIDHMRTSPRAVAQRKINAPSLQPPRRATPVGTTAGAPIQRYLNPMAVEDLIGANVLQGQLGPVIAAYNDAEDRVPEDFDGYKHYSNSYIDAQLQRLVTLDGFITAWINTPANRDNGYARDILEKQIKPNIARDRTEVQNNRVGANVPISQGLIHGTYKWADNSVDLHVAPKGEGGEFSIADIAVVLRKMQQKMAQRTKNGGGVGKFILHPTGAAIVKTLVQLMGEALGDEELVNKARGEIKSRKMLESVKKVFSTPPKKDDDKLDKSVHPEHFAYLDSLVGTQGLAIAPILRGTRTVEERDQNMLAPSEAGGNRLNAYKKSVAENTGLVSLNIEFSAERIPKVLDFLDKRL